MVTLVMEGVLLAYFSARVERRDNPCPSGKKS
jgi:hypothetical protein